LLSKPRPNSAGSQSSGSSISHSDMAKQLAARFPGFFKSAADIEKHVADLADKNPIVHELMQGHLTAADTQSSASGTRSRKGKSSAKPTSMASQAEKFLSNQMMQFLKKERDEHAAN